MTAHRKFFIGAWVTLFVALLVHSGLGMGLAAVLSPLSLLEDLLGWNFLQTVPVFMLCYGFFFSGILVGLCSWIMDRTRLHKKMGFIALAFILMGPSILFVLHDFGYDDWKRTPEVQGAWNSPEADYEPTYWEFYRTIQIQKILAGAMWGLYAATVIGLLLSLLKRLAVIVHRNNAETTLD